jgi:hypothetical protein
MQEVEKVVSLALTKGISENRGKQTQANWPYSHQPCVWAAVFTVNKTGFWDEQQWSLFLVIFGNYKVVQYYYTCANCIFEQW